MLKKPLIAPSILAADFSKLGEEIYNLEKGGADLIHFDVMDGKFVPNITFGMPIIKALRKQTELPFDVHLMIEQPMPLIEEFVHAGADYITVHVEAVTHLNRVISYIKSLGVKAGVSIVPTTHESVLDYVYDNVDLILVMTVNPGFCGQRFIENQISKIAKIRSKIDQSGRNIILSVDGGINSQNAAQIVKAGANMLVAGNAVFNGNYGKNIATLKG